MKSFEGKDVKVVGYAKGWYAIEVDGKSFKARRAELPQSVQATLKAESQPKDDFQFIGGPTDASPPPKKEVAMPAVKKGRKTPARSKAKLAARSKAAKAANGAIVRTADNKDYTYKVTGKTASGNVAYDCGDKVAAMLRGKPIDEVYEITAKHMLGKKLNGDFASCTTVDGIVRKLRSSLKDANIGRQRMTLGNRLRAALRAPAAN